MEEGYMISGIQQCGIGCVNFEESWKWYIEMFHFDVRALEDDTVAERMLRYTGGVPQKRHACVALNLQGGGGLEIWQYSERTPKPVGFDVMAGDLGIFAVKIKTRDAAAFHKELSAKYDRVGPLELLPDGTPSFMLIDPWNNSFQIVEYSRLYLDEHRLDGGVLGVLCGCTDIDRTVCLYHDVLGYDTVVYDKTGNFDDLKFMKGGEGRFRRVLLSHSKERSGALAELFGPSRIELFQALDRTPRKIYEGRYWGDPGFIQVCFDVTGMRALEKKFESYGFPFTVDSCKDNGHFDMGEASGHFTYIEDPDGTLIELVEVHKLTILKKPHIYIDMLKRNRKKSFPKWMVRMMGWTRVRFK